MRALSQFLTLDDFQRNQRDESRRWETSSGATSLSYRKEATVRAVIIRGAGKDFAIGGHRDMLIGLGRARAQREGASRFHAGVL